MLPPFFGFIQTGGDTCVIRSTTLWIKNFIRTGPLRRHVLDFDDVWCCRYVNP